MKLLSHARIFRIVSVFTFLFFIGVMVMVVIVAQGRPSGSAGIDAKDMLQMRHNAALEFDAERTSQE